MYKTFYDISFDCIVFALNVAYQIRIYYIRALETCVSFRLFVYVLVFCLSASVSLCACFLISCRFVAVLRRVCPCSTWLGKTWCCPVAGSEKAECAPPALHLHHYDTAGGRQLGPVSLLHALPASQPHDDRQTLVGPRLRRRSCRGPHAQVQAVLRHSSIRGLKCNEEVVQTNTL